MAFRNSVLGSDATITRYSFIDTSKGSVITSPRALEIACYERNAALEKLQKADAESARRQARQDRRARSIDEEARRNRNARVQPCVVLAGTGVEKFSWSMRCMIERRAVARMQTISKKQYG